MVTMIPRDKSQTFEYFERVLATTACRTHSVPMQNTSHAVMAQRIESRESLDDFPTPPWATRALLEHVIGANQNTLSCLEPACGAGHMARPLSEYFSYVEARDISSYTFGKIEDFLSSKPQEKWDWIITNPPFRLAENFIKHALKKINVGAAFLVRTTFIESVGRYNRLFIENPPSIFAQFVERVPMVKGRLDRTASTATGYCWLIWYKENELPPNLVWIPPCRKQLEYPSDYPSVQASLDF